MSFLNSAYIPSPRKMGVVAKATFTQLMRMKIFLFLAVFCIAILLISSIKPEFYLGIETYGANSLPLLKSSAFGAIRLFGLVFCVLATSLLLPKDTEDRILYTILSKPVHRVDYLMGKALGVIALMTFAILIMDVLMSSMLWLRSDAIITEQRQILTQAGYSAQGIEAHLNMIRAESATWNLQAGILVLIMECAVLTSMTLLLSCLTGGTIISALLSFAVYVIGIFQMQAKVIWMGSGGEGLTNLQMLAGQAFSLIFPNYGMYSITDSLINGQSVGLGLLGQLLLVTLAYFIFQIVLAAWLFRKKEF